MHPDLAWRLSELHQKELAADIRASQVAQRRGRRRWRLSWTTLSPRDVAGARSSCSTWTVIISASRPHRAGGRG
jgi:hypothetical protein